MTELKLPFDEYVAPLERARLVIREAPDQFRAGFYTWLSDNWTLYHRFEQQGIAVAMRGRKHYSAYTIVEYLRHETMLRDQDEEFKLNQAWSSSMARLFAHLNPQHADLFEFRVRKGGVVAEFEPVEVAA